MLDSGGGNSTMEPGGSGAVVAALAVLASVVVLAIAKVVTGAKSETVVALLGLMVGPDTG